jgi:hypothetical protein
MGFPLLKAGLVMDRAMETSVDRMEAGTQADKIRRRMSHLRMN